MNTQAQEPVTAERITDMVRIRHAVLRSELKNLRARSQGLPVCAIIATLDIDVAAKVRAGRFNLDLVMFVGVLTEVH